LGLKDLSVTAPTYDELAAVVVGLQVRIAEQDAETSPGFAHQRVKTSPAGSSGVFEALVITDAAGRLLFCGHARPGAIHDLTHVRQIPVFPPSPRRTRPNAGLTRRSESAWSTASAT